MRWVGLSGIVVIALGAGAGADAPPRTSALLAEGKAAYEGPATGCAACHGRSGEGNGPVAFSLKPPPRNLVKDKFKAGDSVEQIYTTITRGLPETRMVGYPHLDERTRWAIAHYIASLRGR